MTMMPGTAPDERDELFTELVVSNPAKKERGAAWWAASIVGHGGLIAALVVVPLLLPAPLPEQPNYIRALIYNPPPPPPPPPPKGSAMMEQKPPETVGADPAPTPEPEPDQIEFPEVQEEELVPDAGQELAQSAQVMQKS